jgi:uncharacterized protein (UPF0248 family)
MRFIKDNKFIHTVTYHEKKILNKVIHKLILMKIHQYYSFYQTPLSEVGLIKILLSYITTYHKHNILFMYNEEVEKHNIFMNRLKSLSNEDPIYTESISRFLSAT